MSEPTTPAPQQPAERIVDGLIAACRLYFAVGKDRPMSTLRTAFAAILKGRMKFLSHADQAAPESSKFCDKCGLRLDVHGATCDPKTAEIFNAPDYFETLVKFGDVVDAVQGSLSDWGTSERLKSGELLRDLGNRCAWEIIDAIGTSFGRPCKPFPIQAATEPSEWPAGHEHDEPTYRCGAFVSATGEQCELLSDHQGQHRFRSESVPAEPAADAAGSELPDEPGEWWRDEMHVWVFRPSAESVRLMYQGFTWGMPGECFGPGETTELPRGGWLRCTPSPAAPAADVAGEQAYPFRTLKQLKAELAFAVQRADDSQAKLTTSEAQVERLRTKLLSAAGDDLCRLSQEEIKAYTSGAVQIPPKEEFLASCERFHEQIAAGPGVLTNCLTLTQLIAENERLRAELVKEGPLNAESVTLDELLEQLARWKAVASGKTCVSFEKLCFGASSLWHQTHRENFRKIDRKPEALSRWVLEYDSAIKDDFPAQVLTILTALRAKLATSEARVGVMTNALEKIEGGHFDTPEDDLDAAMVATQACARMTLAGSAPPPILAELAAVKARVAELENKYRHIHVSRMDGTDTCAKCGMDLRDEIHERLSPSPTTKE